MSPIEVIQKAICCPSGNCYAIEYNFKYPQKHQHPCMSHTKEPEATAALLALSQMEPTAEMLMDGYAAIAETRVSGVSGMTIDAQWKARGAKANACFKAMLAAAIND